MNKVFVKADHLVVKSHKNERGSEVIHESELNVHQQVLFKGTRLEANLWSKAPNEEVRNNVVKWLELRARIRQPLPSENVEALQQDLANLENSFKSLLTKEKSQAVQSLVKHALAAKVEKKTSHGKGIGY